MAGVFRVWMEGSRYPENCWRCMSDSGHVIFNHVKIMANMMTWECGHRHCSAGLSPRSSVGQERIMSQNVHRECHP